MTGLDIHQVSILSEDAQALIARLDQELAAEYIADHRHLVDFEPFHREGGVFVVAYERTLPIACGGLRPIDQADVELKRMYVIESYRGRGVARSVLQYLEATARQRGFRKLLLETGDQQKAAIRLYRASGYQPIEPFGEYVDTPRSLCFCKEL